MKYLFSCVALAACVHAPEPRQNNEWITPPARYGEVTVQGQRAIPPGASSAEAPNAEPPSPGTENGKGAEEPPKSGK